MSIQIEPYRRKAQYHETDQMGIIHHSNYIRWFEEARVHFLDQIGLGYHEMEKQGIVSPVLSITCDYKAMVRFNDDVVITAKVDQFSGVKLFISYEVRHAATEVVCTVGTSSHCFLNMEGRPISLKKHRPDMYDKLQRFNSQLNSRA